MRRIKKILSLILLASILLSDITPLAVLAMEKKGASNSISIEGITPKGDIEVEANLALPIRNTDKTNIVFKITDTNKNSATLNLDDINNAKDGIYETTRTIGSQKDIRILATKRDNNGHVLSGIDLENNIVYLSINLYSLNKGTYTIEMSGKNFVTYKTTVKLDDYSKRVSFSNEKGMFEIGDINNDGVVNNQDSNTINEAIETNDTSKDLNLDGNIDIADLNYVTAIINGDKKSAKTENTNAIINTDNITLDMSKSTIQSGEVSNLFKDEGTLTLKPVNEGKISEENPINLDINLTNNDSKPVEMSEIVIKSSSNMPTKGTIKVEGTDLETKKEIQKEVAIPNIKKTTDIHKFTEDLDDDDVIQIDLGKQIAVKKVTIKITETSTNDLASIAKVEFLNNVKTETKMPDNFYTPDNIKIDDTKSEQLTVSFNNVPNVTGYEIKIKGKNMGSDGKVFQTTFNTFTIEDLKNYNEYTITVRSVNQQWRSDYSKEYKATPKTNNRPPAVDMVKATPTFSGIDYSWKDMDDTLTYNIYYRKVGDKEFKKDNKEPIEKNNYQLRGLDASSEYEAYITGVNPNGEGPKSQTVKATTLKKEATITPKYNLINDTLKDGKTSHIKDVIPNKGIMTDNNKFAMVDDNYKTYFSFNDWTAGGHGYQYEMPTTILDKTYTMDEFVITVPDEFQYTFKTGTYDKESAQYKDTLVYYWNTESEKTSKNAKVVSAIITTKKDKNQRPYYVLKLEDPIEANAIQIGLTNAQNQKSIQVAELKLYEYDSLVDDVSNLFTDNLRLELADGVTEKTIEDLKTRANTKNHDEYSPYRDSVLMDLDYALKILKDEKVNKDVITLNPNISNSLNGNLGFAMTISDYQPLGIVARPGDTLNVYVGAKGTLGSDVNVQLVYTQYYAEASEWQKTTKNLKIGQNIIKIDEIGSALAERGGSVYVRYTSKPNANNPIKIRVSGGHKIPILDTTLLDNEKDKLDAIKTYINDLKKYNASLNETYQKEGKTLNKNESVLASTEIVTKYGLLSVSSIAVEDAINAKLNTEEEKINRLYETTEAFDEMMLYFYRQKGLEVDAKETINAVPKSRINIRYMRMFYGAFMYAGGYHIGIEYGSIAGLIQGSRYSDDKTGYFGWGISHEIGHQINQKSTAYAEVTNNIYALLAQSGNDSDETRLENSKIYDKIYTKVTSNTIGRDQNVFTQLGMYWQLHLAYDDNKTFDDKNSIYAKVNKIARTYKNDKNYSRDDLTVLFASKAANKNLIDFFSKWGIVVSDGMKQEIEDLNLESENKAIYYLNDEARRYRLKNGKENGISDDTKVKATMTESSSVKKKVTINLDVNQELDKILGYEILRNDVPVGFVTKDKNTFVDNIGAENNRAYTYKVVAYDYLLNKTEAVTLDEVKISNNGTVLKDNFTIESNVKEKDEKIDYEDASLDYSKLAVNKLIDNKNDTYFDGTEKITTINHGDKLTTKTDDNNAYVIINLNDKFSISGIEYKAALKDNKLLDNTIKKYKIYVSKDKENWGNPIKTGTFNLTEDNNYTDLVYFTKDGSTSTNQLWTYSDVAYIKIESDGNKNGLSGAEFNIISPPNDNVDISLKGNEPVIGKLDKDFCYLEGGCKDNEDGIIKKDSVIFKGTYTGSPTFNILTIGDAYNEKNVYGGYQLIFAEVDKDKTIYDVALGTWIYVMTKEEYELMLSKTSSIRAYLYRVNNVKPIEGQRLTSTSLKVNNLKTYANLPTVSISNDDLNK